MSGDGTISAVLLIIITIFIPPIGVFMVAGCGCDLLINILLTLLGYFPGHIHAFYVEYVYYKRRDEARMGVYESRPAAGVYSDRVQRGGQGPPPAVPAAGAPPAGYPPAGAPPAGYADAGYAHAGAAPAAYPPADAPPPSYPAAKV